MDSGSYETMLLRLDQNPRITRVTMTVFKEENDTIRFLLCTISDNGR